jgi:hypothetical protein
MLWLILFLAMSPFRSRVIADASESTALSLFFKMNEDLEVIDINNFSIVCLVLSFYDTPFFCENR